MYTSILRKCIDELKKSPPKIDYVLGMLETLSEMQSPLSTATAGLASVVVHKDTGGVKEVNKDKDIDEAAVLDAKARAAIETVKSMGQIENNA